VRRKTAAFTVVELLMVCAISSVLTCLLLSVLRKAHSLAQISSCANNLHQLAIGTIQYAQDNAQFLPPPNISLTGIANWAQNGGGGARYLLYAPKYGVHYNRAHNLALLNQLGYTKDASLYFCPRDPLRGTLGYFSSNATKTVIWPMTTNLGGVVYSYTYNPYGATYAYNISASYNNQAVMHPSFPRLPKFPAGRPLAMDSVMQIDWHSGAWNLLYPDGRVKTKKSQQAVAQFCVDWNPTWAYCFVLCNLTGKTYFSSATRLEGEAVDNPID
jgi:type II secretory pathway pseudopilin PulG